jgi:flagellar export protein FliJ
MKKFKFSLESVHRVREVRQEREMLALKELQLQAEKAASGARALEELRLAAMRTYAQRLRSREEISPLEMELSSSHFASLNRRQQEADREVAEKNLQCTNQVVAVAGAVKEVKLTNRLKEKQFARFETERQRVEQSMLDELISTSFARKGSANR